MSDYIDRQAAIDAIERLILPQTKGETMAEETNFGKSRKWLGGGSMSDYIDRQAAIEAVGLNTWAGSRLAQIPHVEVEPVKHGRWKPFDLTWGRSVYACTSCGEAFEVPTEMEKPIFIYCPNCGAKMEAAPTIIEAEEGEEDEIDRR